MPNFGTGSPLLGGLQGVANGMMQPGGSNVLTQQQSPVAAGFNPNIQAQPFPTINMPNKTPTGPMGRFAQGIANPAPQVPQATPQRPQQRATMDNPLQSRIDLIVRALTQHLASLDKSMAPQTQ